MPMRWGRAAKYVKLGKARFRLHRKLGIKYLELLEKPSGFDTQKIVLGFDPGSIYDGFSVVSDQCHHENIELIHNKNIKKRMDKRRVYRKLRRSKLRNRPARFDSRTSSKLPPTIQSMLDYRLWLVNQISQLYSVNHVVYERPRFNFWKKKFSGYATKVMQGLNKLVEALESKSLIVTEKSGFETKDRRVEIFGDDLKTNDKGSKSFFAHCFDSYCLATIDLDSFPILNKKTRFITKIWRNKRELYKEQTLPSTKHRPNQSLYRLYEKGGVIRYLHSYFGKKRISKIQIYPNSFKKFRLVETSQSLKLHKYRKAYGGTVKSGISKYGRYINLNTKNIVLTQDICLCKNVSQYSENFNFLGYQRRNITVTV